ncbi:MAG TPA: translation elongation factor Ts [Solirubrobacteraceae bacterium]|nr:translation elongation factor Ts [Solirubrobacteraceae bacterium]
MSQVAAADVKALRERTGAGMMDCKRALEEAQGDMERATEILRVKGRAQAAKRTEREAAEGAIECYLHFNRRVGVLVEVGCETDFVARNEELIAFARDLAAHIAHADPRYIAASEVPEEEIASERRVLEEQAADQPEQVRERITEGRLRKWLEEIVLLDQQHINSERYGKKTIEELRAELAAKTGENIVIRRFARFAIGS